MVVEFFSLSFSGQFRLYHLAGYSELSRTGKTMKSPVDFWRQLSKKEEKSSIKFHNFAILSLKPYIPLTICTFSAKEHRRAKIKVFCYITSRIPGADWIELKRWEMSQIDSILGIVHISLNVWNRYRNRLRNGKFAKQVVE